MPVGIYNDPGWYAYGARYVIDIKSKVYDLLPITHTHQGTSVIQLNSYKLERSDRIQNLYGFEHCRPLYNITGSTFKCMLLAIGNGGV